MDANRSYREAAARGAGPVRLVVLLYEQAIADLGRALAAQQRGDIEARAREVSHAMLVLGHLESSLDSERGGQVARNLKHFYGQVRAGLIDAQCRQSAETIEQQISLLMTVHEAWCEVERVNTTQTTAPAVAPSSPTPVHRTAMKWKA